MSTNASPACMRQLFEYLKSHSPLPTTNSMLQRGGAQCLKTFHKWKLSITSGMTFLSVVTLLSRFTNSYSSKTGDTYCNAGATPPGASTTSRFGYYGNKDQDFNPELFIFVSSTLKKNEYSYRLASCFNTADRHSNKIAIRVTGYDSNTLASNQPNEDRNVEGMLLEGGVLMFAVIDGHKGDLCSEALKQDIINQVGERLSPLLNDASSNVTQLPITFNSRPGTHACPLVPNVASLAYTGLIRTDKTHTPSDVDDIAQKLQGAFVDIDNQLEQKGRIAAERYQKTKKLSQEDLENLKRFYQGACAIMACIVSSELYIANTGDCRAVIGSKIDGKWVATALSNDHTAQNPNELIRLYKAHPSERVIQHGRLLGGLMPLRSFGDAEYKWPSELLHNIVSVSPSYQSPPYLTARPEMSHHTISSQDRFLVMATDGLWEKMSNQEAVELIGRSLDNQPSEQKKKDSSWLSGIFFNSPRSEIPEETCSSSSSSIDSNRATMLIKNALGADIDSVNSMLSLSPSVSRMHRDDITVTVVYFNGKK